jgi:hypothetical protein
MNERQRSIEESKAQVAAARRRGIEIPAEWLAGCTIEVDEGPEPIWIAPLSAENKSAIESKIKSSKRKAWKFWLYVLIAVTGLAGIAVSWYLAVRVHR